MRRGSHRRRNDPRKNSQDIALRMLPRSARTGSRDLRRRMTQSRKQCGTQWKQRRGRDVEEKSTITGSRE